MGRGKKLDESEVKIILNMHKKKKKIAEIAECVNRSRKVVMNLIRSPENYGKKKSPGRPKVLSIKDRRAILRVASNCTLTARQIADKVGIKTNVRNVQKILQQSVAIQKGKMKRKPLFTKLRKEQKLKFKTNFYCRLTEN